MCKTSYVSKSSKLSLVKGFVLDTSTQLRAREDARAEGGDMTYRAERFNRSMRSLEAMVSGMVDASKSAKLSDRGRSAARMYAAFEPEPDAPDRDQELAGAVIRLIVAGKDYLAPTLLLIAENGGERERSMQHVPKTSYFRHRDELLEFFVGL